jgi:hypothetical protein
MDEELFILHKTNTWDPVPLPPGKSVVSCHLMYKIKTNSDRFICPSFNSSVAYFSA